jgi:hypothetical protein
VLIEQDAMQALDDAVRLRALDPGGAVLDLFELQEQLVRLLVGLAAELAAVMDSTVSIIAAWASRVGMKSLFIRCTALTDSLFG